LKKQLTAKGYRVAHPGGSIALSMAQLAAGNMDGLVIGNDGGKGSSWDVAAGYYLLKGNGFCTLDETGKPL